MANVVLRLPEVIRRVGLSKSSIYNRIAAGAFPSGFSLGPQSRGWLESEIEEWIADRAATRRDSEHLATVRASKARTRTPSLRRSPRRDRIAHAMPMPSLSDRDSP
jgi:prophage regulatory protein